MPQTQPGPRRPGTNEPEPTPVPDRRPDQPERREPPRPDQDLPEPPAAEPVPTPHTA